VNRLDREQQTLKAMIALSCKALHKPKEGLCPDCAALEKYALTRLEQCTYGAAKPTCAACPIHCYKPAMREAVCEVMRYAGPRMLAHHPLLTLGHMMGGLLSRPPKTKRKAL
jgi:hypothetical protein